MLDTSKYTEEQLKNGAQYYDYTINGEIIDDSNSEKFEIMALNTARNLERSMASSLINVAIGVFWLLGGAIIYGTSEGMTQKKIYNQPNQPNEEQK